MKWIIAGSFVLSIALFAGYGLFMVWEIHKQGKRMTYTSIWHDDKERIL